MHLTFSMCILEIQVEERVFQNCDLGLSFYFIKIEFGVSRICKRLPDF